MFYICFIYVYMCHGGFKNRGLRERPVTENGGLSELAHTRKGGFGAKNKKEICIFILKGKSFRAAQVEKL